MNKTLFVLMALLFSIFPLSAQTPFDAFSPETSRIILDGDSIASWRAEQQSHRPYHRPTQSRPDTILCALIADLRNEQLLLVDIASHRPVAAAPFTDEIKNWLSVDPLVDKNITTSPYLYCNGNPIMFIDPDGRDDEFNSSGEFIRHVDNGTDFVMIQTEDGSFRNVTEFDYSSDREDNLRMLSNVGSYYMRMADMEGVCGVKEKTSREGAFAGTGSISRNLFLLSIMESCAQPLIQRVISLMHLCMRKYM